MTIEEIQKLSKFQLTTALRNKKIKIENLLQFHSHIKSIYGITEENIRNDLLFEVLDYYLKTKDLKIFKYYQTMQLDFSFDSFYKIKKIIQTKKSVSVFNEEYAKLAFGRNWKRVLDDIKSKKANIYDPTYISKRDNISVGDAELQINKFKKDKATSKSAFIKRHGEEVGLKKFQKFQKTSKQSSDFDFWLKTYYGNNPVEDFKLFNRRKSKRCIEYWIHNHNQTFEEAQLSVSLYQKSNSGIHREYYTKQGYSEKEIDMILLKINENRSGSVNGKIFYYLMRKNNKLSLQQLIDLHSDIFDIKLLEKYFIRYENLSETDILIKYLLRYKRSNKQLFEKYSNMVLASDINLCLDEIVYGFHEYTELVGAFTKLQKIHSLENYELRGNKHGYDLDHKYSILQGFIDGIKPEIIGSIVNLQIIPKSENRIKSANCSISKQELLSLFENINEN